MARLRDGRHRRSGAMSLAGCRMELMIGPTEPEPDLEEWRLAWELFGDRVLGDYADRPGHRPWAYWMFEVGEPPPGWDREDGMDRETIRLAELGRLTPAELAALEEAANEARLRIGTDRELISGGWRTHGVSLDVQAVELWEAVQAARRDGRAGDRDGPESNPTDADF